MHLLGERLAPTIPPPPADGSPFAAQGFQEIVREQRVSWSQLPKLEVSVAAELDSWFMSFEARMKAARVNAESWPARFLECPMVDESLKVLVRTLDPLTYDGLRSMILKEHGPVDPVNFFKREMFRVRGNNREDVREALMHILVMHNRAAEAVLSQELSRNDLCYPFMEAFPVEVRRSLEQQLALVFAQDDPFEHLFRLSPSKQDQAKLMQATTTPEADQGS